MGSVVKGKDSLREKSKNSFSGDITTLLWWTPLLLACAYVAFTPYADALTALQLYDTKRLLQIGLLLVAAACTAGVPSLRLGWLATFRALPQAARWGLGMVLVLGVVSAVTAPVPRMALLDVAQYVLLFNLVLVVASVCRTFPKWFMPVFWATLVISAGLYALLFAKGYVGHWISDSLTLWPEGDIGFANKRFFNQFQSWSLPLLAAPGLMPPVRRLRGGVPLTFGLLAFWWMLAFASGGRGILLGMVVALVGCSLLFRKEAWPWLQIHLKAAATGALLYVTVFQMAVSTTGSIAERGADPSTGISRLADWRAAAEALAKEPWLGIGPMHAAYLPNELWPTPHNAVVQFATEWGLPAVLLIVGLAGWGLFAWVQGVRQFLSEEEVNTNQHARSLSTTIRVTLTGALLTAGVHAMVSGVVVMPASQVMMALVLGSALAMHLPQRAPSPSPSVPAERAQWALIALLLIGSTLLVWAVSPDVLSLNTRFAKGVFEHNTLRLPPRYWSYGPFGP